MKKTSVLLSAVIFIRAFKTKEELHECFRTNSTIIKLDKYRPLSAILKDVSLAEQPLSRGDRWTATWIVCLHV